MPWLASNLFHYFSWGDVNKRGHQQQTKEVISPKLRSYLEGVTPHPHPHPHQLDHQKAQPNVGNNLLKASSSPSLILVTLLCIPASPST